MFHGLNAVDAVAWDTSAHRLNALAHHNYPPFSSPVLSALLTLGRAIACFLYVPIKFSKTVLTIFQQGIDPPTIFYSDIFANFYLVYSRQLLDYFLGNFQCIVKPFPPEHHRPLGHVVTVPWVLSEQKDGSEHAQGAHPQPLMSCVSTQPNLVYHGKFLGHYR